MKDKLKEYVKETFYEVGSNFWLTSEVNQFMDLANEVNSDYVDEIKDLDYDDLKHLIYEGNIDAANELFISIRKTMIYNAKKAIKDICLEIDCDEDEEDNASDQSDNGISNSDRLMECDR